VFASSFVGGAHVTLGYLENESQTREAYFTGKDGMRYFMTGDIGQWEQDGTLKIIDRKKASWRSGPGSNNNQQSVHAFSCTFFAGVLR
jgi:long-subunit acyl-CoA synthetase (AMP-forming)